MGNGGAGVVAIFCVRCCAVMRHNQPAESAAQQHSAVIMILRFMQSSSIFV
jgi:hypothetical protein